MCNVANMFSSLRVLVCIALLGGCDPGAGTSTEANTTPPATEGDAGTAVASGPDGGATVQPDSHPATSMDSGRGVDTMPAAGSPDARKTYAACSSAVVKSQSCSRLDFDSKPVIRWKDGWSCAICFPRNAAGSPDFTRPQATGCTVGETLCVLSCDECRE